ncbi:unnamed protein product [Lasius platythorax]|uniref:Uncharacterized protein n=1 Tax=Lasius platythorax TaxID=488582 RepID=A0AAV2NSX1_9HYME
MSVTKMYPPTIEILDAAAKSTRIIRTANKDLNNVLFTSKDRDFTKNLPSSCERYLLRDHISHACKHSISPYRGFIRRRRSSSGIPIC